MFLERVLFATDFSETSRNALGYMLQLREAGCREVILVHVLDTGEEGVLSEPSGGDDPSGEYERQITERRLQNARMEMKAVRVSLEETDLHVRTFLVTGDPPREINRIAESEGAGMIVIGSNGLSNLLHRLIGSVSLGVIQGAACPVLVVRRSERS